MFGEVGTFVNFCLEILGFDGVFGGDREIMRFKRVADMV